MLYAGYLSKDKEFHFGKDKVKIITADRKINCLRYYLRQLGSVVK